MLTTTSRGGIRIVALWQKTERRERNENRLAGFSMGESTTLEQRRDATGGRFETLDLRSASPTNFKVQATADG